MITLHITFTLPSESLTAAMDAMRTARQHIAEEPTCRYFNVYRFTQPGTFRMVEVWDEDVNFLSEVSSSSSYACEGGGMR
jgi:quinol monooxygenase YgiN